VKLREKTLENLSERQREKLVKVLCQNPEHDLWEEYVKHSSRDLCKVEATASWLHDFLTHMQGIVDLAVLGKTEEGTLLADELERGVRLAQKLYLVRELLEPLNKQTNLVLNRELERQTLLYSLEESFEKYQKTPVKQRLGKVETGLKNLVLRLLEELDRKATWQMLERCGWEVGREGSVTLQALRYTESAEGFIGAASEYRELTGGISLYVRHLAVLRRQSNAYEEAGLLLLPSTCSNLIGGENLPLNWLNSPTELNLALKLYAESKLSFTQCYKAAQKL